MAVPVFDLHSDLLLRVVDSGIGLDSDLPWPQTTLPKLRAGGVRCQVFAVWLDDTLHRGAAARDRALRILDAFDEQMARHAASIAHARTLAQAREVTASGRIAALLWLEGGAAIAEDLDTLRRFHARGVCGMTLTWTHSLPWAGSSGDGSDLGLTPFGRDVVRLMNELGLAVDLSHASDRAFFDAVEVSRSPALLTHSCCRALCPVPRNASDEMLRALAATGGVMGINAWADLLSPSRAAAWDAVARALASEIESLRAGRPESAPGFRFERSQLISASLPREARVGPGQYVDHIEHVIAVAGEDHVALGGDFDGIWSWPEGLSDASCWQAVAGELRRRGHGEPTIEKIMHGNAERVLGAILDASGANPVPGGCVT